MNNETRALIQKTRTIIENTKNNMNAVITALYSKEEADKLNTSDKLTKDYVKFTIQALQNTKQTIDLFDVLHDNNTEFNLACNKTLDRQLEETRQKYGNAVGMLCYSFCQDLKETYNYIKFTTFNYSTELNEQQLNEIADYYHIRISASKFILIK